MKYFKIFPLFFLISFSQISAQQDSSEVIFKFNSAEAKSVAIAGSFNNWTPAFHPLKKIDENSWQLKTKLADGYYYYKMVVDGNWIPDPANSEKVNDGGTNFNSILKVGNPPIPKRKTYSISFPKEKFPRPVLTDNPDFIDLYYAALNMAWQKISHGTKQNGFVENYMDEGFSEHIYQWDTNFMVAFGMYMNDLLPAIQSLDNFYRKQRNDGYIQRVYWETNGEIAHEPTKEEPMVNPPLFAWMELKYYKLTADSSRLKKALPVLIKYFVWIEENCKTEFSKNLYYTSELGSGMDNTPRINAAQTAWIDFSSQQALAAKCISQIAKIVGDEKTDAGFQYHYKRIKNDINKILWNENKEFYFDLTRNDTLANTKHIGAFWSLLSEVANDDQAKGLIKHLKNPNEFWRNHLVPTLSADDPHFDPKGHYWLGSVWAPTNYMVVKGLEKYGYENIADEIAMNHIQNMSWIYKYFTPQENQIAYEERYSDGYKTIWECYSSEFKSPATRWDNTFLSRQDFVGWSGLGPIAMLIENILGVELNGAENKIVWRLHRKDKHGIENINFKNEKISLVANPKSENQFEIKVISENPFILEIIKEGKTKSFNLPLNNARKISGGKFESVILL